MTELVFIHGWGFDASFWDALAARLQHFPQRRIDLGFFGGAADDRPLSQGSILIGHSLGFIEGISRHQNWAGWISINGFARFTDGVAPAVLRDMRRRLVADMPETLARFYEMAGAERIPGGDPSQESLLNGLDRLRDADISSELAAMKVPALALASNNDPLVPAAVSAKLPAPIAWHETGGHLLPQSDPAWCAARIEEFLRKGPA